MVTQLFISVDIETDGSIPGDFSMLSIGACVVGLSGNEFYVEIKPISNRFEPEAMAVNGLDRDRLFVGGFTPKSAMTKFNEWLMMVCEDDAKPVFVGYNASFDWMFVHWYFIHFIGRNPFGHSALDIKALYMGALGKTEWGGDLEKPYSFQLGHNALDDARVQGETFQMIMNLLTHGR